MKKKPSGWKYVAPTLCAALVGLFALGYIAMGVMGVFAGMPVALGLLIVALPAAALFGIIYCLLERYKEIRGGEDDDFSNY